MRCQVYIGTAPKPRDVYCITYVSSATERMIIIITSVVALICLCVVVAVVVVCCIVRRRRTIVAAAGVSGDDRYVEGNCDERVDSRHSNIGGNVHRPNDYNNDKTRLVVNTYKLHT